MTICIDRLKTDVCQAVPGICPERALIWTDYFRHRKNRKKPMELQMAEAVDQVLRQKTIRIYPDECIVGNYTSKRVGGIIYPELAGMGALLEIFRFHTRAVNPLETTSAERRRLAAIIPFWITRNISFQAFDSMVKKFLFFQSQLRADEYQIYEAGGISHLAPNYEKLLFMGTTGLIREIETHEQQMTDHRKRDFLHAAKVSAEALARFGDRYAALAADLAAGENDPERKRTLTAISKICGRVPRYGVSTFHEALQSMMLAHIALFQESMGETICPGRLDQILFPYYQKDLAAGRISRSQAKDLLAAFCIKLCETVPVFPSILTKTLGGLPSYQVVTVGGVDKKGCDATNDLSWMLLDIMDTLRMRQPNFHIRIHAHTPQDFYREVIGLNTGMGSAPALYHDEVVIGAMVKAGYAIPDARNYVAIGCVEPTSPGKTLGSTDAGILNMPLALELALNQGRRFGKQLRLGAKTKPVSRMTAMADVTSAYGTQLRHQLGKLARDLKAVERAHAVHHPTPLTSLLLDGCRKKGMCATKGGATYNFSGIQGVGLSTVGDSLYALEKLVFVDKRITLGSLVRSLENDIDSPVIHALLRGLAKFGNDDDRVDRWTCHAVDDFIDAVHDLGLNTRGGRYIAGIYSNTTHVHFGHMVGALPNGRRRGEPFASGMAPENGMDRRGPTALFNSMNRIDYTRLANGVNFNIKFDRSSFRDDAGRHALAGMIGVYFKRGGMQAQINMLDADMLIAAKHNPDLYPNLLIRVSGYSAYFNDLSPEMKDEVIARSMNRV